MRGKIIVNFTGHFTPRSELLLLGENLREVNYPLHLDTRVPIKPQVERAIAQAAKIAGCEPGDWFGVIPVSHPPGAFALGEILAGRVPLLCGRGSKDGNWVVQNVEGRLNEKA